MPNRRVDVLWRFLEGSPREWISFVAAVLAILTLIWLIVRFSEWLRDDEGPAAAEQQMITEVGDLHRQGDLSDEEYRSIQSRLAQKLDGFPREPVGDD